MDVTCPECRSVYRVDPSKVPTAGVDARCAVCGAVVRVRAAAEATPQPVAAATAATATPTAPTPIPAAPAVATPTAASVALPPASPRVAPRSAPGRADQPRPTPQRAAPGIAAASGQPAGDARAPRRYNPYLSNDPGQRARRLARALVSDLVAYHPQRREEGLRNGTLKELFREEIRKSWDEYVEQVGSDVSENTAHFQDALNDLLAGGRRVF